MKLSQLRSIERRLSDFVEEFAPELGRAERRFWCRQYLTGLILDGERKSIEPLASRVPGGNEQSLQQFVNQSPWAHEPVQEKLLNRVHRGYGQKQGVLVLDDTSFPKQGKASVGVAHQYCGALGKVANCQVVVSAEYVAEEPESSRPLHWPVSGRLYLPEGWAKDPERRERSHVPREVIVRSKPQIVLCLVDLSREWGVPFEVVVADSGYGKYPSFLGGLEEREVAYVCGVESTFGVRLPQEVRAAKEAGAPPYEGRGQPPKERPSPLYTARELIGSLPEEAWRTVSWREGTKGT